MWTVNQRRSHCSKTSLVWMSGDCEARSSHCSQLAALRATTHSPVHLVYMGVLALQQTNRMGHNAAVSAPRDFSVKVGHSTHSHAGRVRTASRAALFHFHVQREPSLLSTPSRVQSNAHLARSVRSYLLWEATQRRRVRPADQERSITCLARVHVHNVRPARLNREAALHLAKYVLPPASFVKWEVPSRPVASPPHTHLSWGSLAKKAA
mmetsp:Transcript_72719/g.121360  ORF Transcript_72719/g.121360 Transcript_72719/m.121360 type:complete len:209 (+) Transcript_72719:386-1012(+)